MHEVHEMLMVISLLNVVILAVLIYIYSKNLRYIKSKYNISLLLFSLLFLAGNVLIIHLSIFQWPDIASDIVVLHVLIIDIIQFLGLLPLLYITWK